MMAAAVLPVPTILNILNDSDDNYFTDQNVEQPQRAKKRRLDHLSWEEKIQRKKLKNRVAAQTSRDRKKAKVEQMEAAIQQLFTKNETILTECEKLRETNERLQAENAELRERLQQHQGAPPVKCQCQSRSVVCAPVSGSTESLLLRDDVLRPKGAGAHTAATLGPRRATLELRLKILLVCLLCRTCSTSSNGNRSISERWSSSLRPYSRISPEIWRELPLKRQLIKNQPLIQKIFQTKWWGRHQNTWNPVEEPAMTSR